jgi:hypothetical protein
MNSNSIETLPNELITLIFIRCTPIDIIHLQCTSIRFNQLIDYSSRQLPKFYVKRCVLHIYGNNHWNLSIQFDNHRSTVEINFDNQNSIDKLINICYRLSINSLIIRSYVIINQYILMHIIKPIIDICCHKSSIVSFSNVRIDQLIFDRFNCLSKSIDQLYLNDISIEDNHSTIIDNRFLMNNQVLLLSNMFYLFSVTHSFISIDTNNSIYTNNR